MIRRVDAPLLVPFLAGLAAALGAVALPSALPDARAEKPTPRQHLTCRHFETDPSSADGGMFETADQTSEMGQWIAVLESSGWRLYGVDFEFGQKPTGFLIAYTQVCMERPL